MLEKKDYSIKVMRDGETINLPLRGKGNKILVHKFSNDFTIEEIEREHKRLQAMNRDLMVLSVRKDSEIEIFEVKD